MTTSLFPATLSFPRSPTIWTFLPQGNRRSSVQKRDRKNRSDKVGMSNGTTDDEPQSQTPTGVKHWEEQRREWTKGFSRGVNDENDDVNHFFNLDGCLTLF